MQNDLHSRTRILFLENLGGDKVLFSANNRRMYENAAIMVLELEVVVDDVGSTQRDECYYSERYSDGMRHVPPVGYVKYNWRLARDAKGPMQVVSGAIGREKVHYEAPEAGKLNVEMNKFLEWFNKTTTMDPVLKAAIAHLWFVTIYPFDDGNGRIARALADMQLARADASRQCYRSLRKSNETNFFMTLEKTQKGIRYSKWCWGFSHV